ncbi:tetratricopeptide repeat protein, partial [candidate division TA06 bacterium]|nr:tetratricopeptide repeat protein [candidate division TA06 bacterium]
LTLTYSKLCTKAGKILLTNGNGDLKKNLEIENLFRESISRDPENADNWYRLGDLYLRTEKFDEALQHLQKAESLGPKKEYIPHKIAQTFLRKGDVEQALKTYKTIPYYKRTPYILHGIAECLLKKGQIEEAAHYFHLATQREPEKFYHHRDLAFTLITLGDRDQALEELEETNNLFRKEYGKDYQKAISKREEIKNMASGKRVIFDQRASLEKTMSFGTVVKYNADRGFGFIKDKAGGDNVFFHIKSVKDRLILKKDYRVKFLKEKVEKGLQAAKVWLIS